MSSRTVMVIVALPGPMLITCMPSARLARSSSHIASRVLSAISCAFMAFGNPEVVSECVGKF